jgi:hypothetical protein
MPTHFEHRHSLDANLLQRVLHRFQLGVLNDRFDLSYVLFSRSYRCRQRTPGGHNPARAHCIVCRRPTEIETIYRWHQDLLCKSIVISILFAPQVTTRSLH